MVVSSPDPMHPLMFLAGSGEEEGARGAYTDMVEI